LWLQTLILANRFQTTPSEAAAWVRRSYELIACEDLEGWLFPRLSRDNLGKLLTFEGMENLANALAQGKGSVPWGGHVRSGFRFLISLGLLGYRLTVLKRERALGNWVERWFFGQRVRMMEKLGYATYFTHPPNPFVATRALNALKRNEIVFALMDT